MVPHVSQPLGPLWSLISSWMLATYTRNRCCYSLLLYNSLGHLRMHLFLGGFNKYKAEFFHVVYFNHVPFRPRLIGTVLGSPWFWATLALSTGSPHFPLHGLIPGSIGDCPDWLVLRSHAAQFLDAIQETMICLAFWLGKSASDSIRQSYKLHSFAFKELVAHPISHPPHTFNQNFSNSSHARSWVMSRSQIRNLATRISSRRPFSTFKLQVSEKVRALLKNRNFKRGLASDSCFTCVFLSPICLPNRLNPDQRRFKTSHKIFQGQL